MNYRQKIFKALRYTSLIAVMILGFVTIIGTGGSSDNGNGGAGSNNSSDSSSIMGAWQLDKLSYNGTTADCPGSIETAPGSSVGCSNETLRFYSDNSFTAITESYGNFVKGKGTWGLSSNVVTCEITMKSPSKSEMPSENDLIHLDVPYEIRLNYNSSDDTLSRSYPEAGGQVTYIYYRESDTSINNEG